MTNHTAEQKQVLNIQHFQSYSIFFSIDFENSNVGNKRGDRNVPLFSYSIK